MFTLLKKQLQIVFIIVVIILVIFGVIWGFLFFNQGSKMTQDRINVNINKTAILQQVRELQVLNTVEQTLQRDFDIELKSEDLGLFGISILESSRTQKFAVTGSVTAGIDLSQIKEGDITFDRENNKIKIKTPEPVITNISLLEDKIYLISDRSSFFFNVQNLNQDVNRNRNQQLQQEVLKNGNSAILDAACKNNILETANQNADRSLKNLFLLVQNDLDLEIETTQSTECKVVSKTEGDE